MRNRTVFSSRQRRSYSAPEPISRVSIVAPSSMRCKPSVNRLPASCSASIGFVGRLSRMNHIRWASEFSRVLAPCRQLHGHISGDLRCRSLDGLLLGSPHCFCQVLPATAFQGLDRTLEVPCLPVLAELALALDAGEFDFDADNLRQHLGQIVRRGVAHAPGPGQIRLMCAR